MKIYGLNKKNSKGLYIVYTTINGRKYFFSAYKTKNKAQEVAAKYNGKIFFNS